MDDVDEALVRRFCHRIRDHMMFGEFLPWHDQVEFWDWLTDGINCCEKDAAMYLMFELFLDNGTMFSSEEEMIVN